MMDFSNIPLGITLEDLTADQQAHVSELMRPFHVSKAKSIRNAPQELIFRQQARLLRDKFVHTPDVDRVLTVFHATARQNSGSIMSGGFDVSRAGTAHGTALGAGIYVATTPTFSDLYAKTDGKGDRLMFICDALPGKAATHSKKSGNQIVLKRECQVLPRYLVYYRAKASKAIDIPNPAAPKRAGALPAASVSQVLED